jgi:RHH-type proline utilization regulon transcriptional repressor/proline dehydrogenase/delta 1-pyrroline-5-carboxylate dehydrogenase
MPERLPRSWVFDAANARLPWVDASISAHYLADEGETVQFLLEQARLSTGLSGAVSRTARRLVEGMREQGLGKSGPDALLSEYDLSTSEGVVLMCLAEALLRIPDADTADKLIADKLASADWQAHLGPTRSLFVNASTWALMLSGRLLQPEDTQTAPGAFLGRLIERLGEPVVRSALRRAMKILGHQFVMGETIESALKRTSSAPGIRYSFDMLGEAALTAEDARRYLDAYSHAIEVLAEHGEKAPTEAPGVSVKLSALYPRYEFAQSARAVAALTDRLLGLASAARDAGIVLTVDAEEADRLEPSLLVFKRVFQSPALSDYSGLGLAVQAYQKRAWHVLQWAEELARDRQRVIPVRLVKGAYWDSEIKRAQEQGLAEYPVFTRKVNTDVSYLACAKLLLHTSPHLYPQFATHNAHTVAWILEVGAHQRFEFQRLHGMGEELYTQLSKSDALRRPCRVYAPVGSHRDLLPYLVRRLLENGANTSFINRSLHATAPVEEVIADPVEQAEALLDEPRHPKIPLPKDLFGKNRVNSRGWNLADPMEMRALANGLENAGNEPWHGAPSTEGRSPGGRTDERKDPSDERRVLGSVTLASPAVALEALQMAAEYQAAWNAVPAPGRAELLREAARLFETHAEALVARCVAEAGRSVPNAIAELRETVDFLRYYASEAERLLAAPLHLPGPTGESNELRLTGRGVFVCISPWNFPLSIFTGQVAAALASGNTVLAKPAEQTCLTAALATELLQRAGIPPQALHLLPGDGPSLAETLLPDARVAGVAFTGSVEAAHSISRRLSSRDGPLGTLIAETGGVNAMIVDSSALPEQVVRDAAQSAFDSAGQRCSALRLLCLQEETADRIVTMLRGFMDELVIGDPASLSTDVGPVIDEASRTKLAEYVAGRQEKVLHQLELDASHAHGFFFPPTLVELASPRELTTEIFGPVLHVVRYRAERLNELLDSINATGFGLTLGVHSRIESFAQEIARRAKVGNVYVNRNMIGAQVGVQPFGGMGMSGTGPKAGGPHYLLQFAAEQTMTINTSAVGGNATLLSLAEDAGD